MQDGTKNLEGNNVQGARGKNRKANNVARACKKQKGGQQLSMLCQLYTQFVDISLPHQAGIELSDFHARSAWKSDQVHGIPTNKRKQQFLNFHLLPRNQF